MFAGVILAGLILLGPCRRHRAPSHLRKRHLVLLLHLAGAACQPSRQSSSSASSLTCQSSLRPFAASPCQDFLCYRFRCQVTALLAEITSRAADYCLFFDSVFVCFENC